MKKYLVFGWLLFISISLFPNYKIAKHLDTHSIILLQTTNDNNTDTDNNTNDNNIDINNNGIDDTDDNTNNGINNEVDNDNNDTDTDTDNLTDTNNDNDFTTNMLYGVGGIFVGGFIMYFVGASTVRRKP